MLLRAVVERLVPLVPAEVDALTGLELGGIPIVTMLSRLTGLPAVFVRKKAKDYGTCRLAEGGEVVGRRLVIVEDVVSAGGAIIDATRELRQRGAVIGIVLCVIDRESVGSSNLSNVASPCSWGSSISPAEAPSRPSTEAACATGRAAADWLRWRGGSSASVIRDRGAHGASIWVHGCRCVAAGPGAFQMSQCADQRHWSAGGRVI